MSKIRVAINGYGNIGKRVADAVAKQKDMALAGVTKATPDYRALEAIKRNFSLFSIGDVEEFTKKGIEAQGTVNDLLAVSDIVIDCSPGNMGKSNIALYKKFPHLKIIYQGGEDASIAPVSFNAQSNFDKAIGLKSVRVVSCNTTALCRVLGTLDEYFGVKKARAALVRRATDPNNHKKGIINAWAPVPQFPSHHALDVNSILPEIKITSLAGLAPTTLMHGHMLFIECEKPLKDISHVFSALNSNRRIMFMSTTQGLESTAQLKDLAYEHQRPRGDLYEVCIWRDGMGLDSDGELGIHLAIGQQAVVVPENIDAIRAMCNLADKNESMKLTDDSLEMGELGIESIKVTKEVEN